MRLTAKQIGIIIEKTAFIFGDNAKVYLFGSRMDDTKKGGDIDLYIVPENKEDLHEKKVKFLTALEMVLGEQKIDVVFAKDYNRLIEKEAITKGIELKLDAIKLEKKFKECDKHLQRINEAYGDMTLFMPICSVKYENLSKQDVQAIDQYLFRFSKLQDTMGEMQAIVLYQNFVRAGVGLPPIWEQLKNQIFLGEQLFVERLQNQIQVESEELKEIPKA